MPDSQENSRQPATFQVLGLKMIFARQPRKFLTASNLPGFGVENDFCQTAKKIPDSQNTTDEEKEEIRTLTKTIRNHHYEQRRKHFRCKIVPGNNKSLWDAVKRKMSNLHPCQKS